MDKRLFLMPLAALAGPAYATGGFICRTAGAGPIEITIGFGHVPGAALLQDSTRLVDHGRAVPVTALQWWLDQAELRLLLANPAATRRELILKTRRNGQVYDGSLWRNGKRRWVRCRES